MRLAADDTVIDVPPAIIILRPTLRAAFRLERKYDGFDKLARAVLSGNLGAISDVIKEGSGQTGALTDFLDQTEILPLNVSLDLMIAPIVRFILELSGVDGEPIDPMKVPTIDRITYAEHHKRLYRIATGWLGWTPTDAWDATPAEIIEAHKGRTEMLAAIFGGKSDNSPDVTPEQRASLNAIGDLSNFEMPVT